MLLAVIAKDYGHRINSSKTKYTAFSQETVLISTFLHVEVEVIQMGVAFHYRCLVLNYDNTFQQRWLAAHNLEKAETALFEAWKTNTKSQLTVGNRLNFLKTWSNRFCLIGAAQIWRHESRCWETPKHAQSGAPERSIYLHLKNFRERSFWNQFLQLQYTEFYFPP